MNRNAFKAKVAELFTAEETMLIMSAYDYAKVAHRNQERESIPQKSPTSEKRYFNHPKHLALAMIEAGIRDANTICVALLHDCSEDTGIFGNQFTDGYYEAMTDTRFRLTRAFNAQVAEDVIALTIPVTTVVSQEFSSKTKCLKFYRTKLQTASVSALLGKLFDRLHNLETIEVKPRDIAMLKLNETVKFYVPLFCKNFKQQDTNQKKIGYEKTLELVSLALRKAWQINLLLATGK